MSDLQPVGYQLWLGDLKAQIQVAQQRAILAVNQELLKLYWQIGNDILQRQQQQGWGSKVIDQLAKDLRVAFPELKGFSARNLKYMRAFAEAWREPEFVQQPVAQLPWGHHLVLLTKLKESSSRLSYAALVQQHGWSRNVLVHQIESQVLQRQGQATTNFAQTLPAPQSALRPQNYPWSDHKIRPPELIRWNNPSRTMETAIYRLCTWMNLPTIPSKAW